MSPSTSSGTGWGRDRSSWGLWGLKGGKHVVTLPGHQPACDPAILRLALFVNIHRIWSDPLRGRFKYQPPAWPTGEDPCTRHTFLCPSCI